MRGKRRARIAAALVLGTAVVVWNAVFDRGINEATERYLALQQEHATGARPFVRVQDIMRPATVESARRATAWTGLVLIAGLLAVVWVSRQSRQFRS